MGSKDSCQTNNKMPPLPSEHALIEELLSLPYHYPDRRLRDLLNEQPSKDDIKNAVNRQDELNRG